VQATPPLDPKARGVRDAAFAGEGLLCVAQGNGAIQVRRHRPR
jgi:uncharacterized protein (AIM24 family)